MTRILFADDNIKSLDGHYFEIATLMATGACQMGFESVLAANVNFHGGTHSAIAELGESLSKVFSTDRLVTWSLGVDGRSIVVRDETTTPQSGSTTEKMKQRWIDFRSPPARRPKRMLSTWTEEILNWLHRIQVCESDVLVLNTSDDFQMLALPTLLRALKQKQPKQIHVIFHFAVFEGKRPCKNALNMGRQINETLRKCSEISNRVDIKIHATTDPLVRQLAEVGVAADLIPYPTRKRQLEKWSPGNSSPLNLLFGGWPRREKGTKAVTGFLSDIESSQLKNSRFRVSMQLPQKKWQRIVPRSLHDICQIRSSFEFREERNATHPAIDLITQSISSDLYQDWLDTADVGVFLYDAQRYVARCSAVLLELLVRGIPVIVPADCWLDDQVQLAGGHGTVGFVYRSVDEIPNILDSIRADYDTLRERAIEYSQTIANRHDPRETIRALGV